MWRQTGITNFAIIVSCMFILIGLNKGDDQLEDPDYEDEEEVEDLEEQILEDQILSGIYIFAVADWNC